MAEAITLELPDAVARRAWETARRTGRLNEFWAHGCVCVKPCLVHWKP